MNNNKWRPQRLVSLLRQERGMRVCERGRCYSGDLDTGTIQSKSRSYILFVLEIARVWTGRWEVRLAWIVDVSPKTPCYKRRPECLLFSPSVRRLKATASPTFPPPPATPSWFCWLWSPFPPRPLDTLSARVFLLFGLLLLEALLRVALLGASPQEEASAVCLVCYRSFNRWRYPGRSPFQYIVILRYREVEISLIAVIINLGDRHFERLSIWYIAYTRNRQLEKPPFLFTSNFMRPLTQWRDLSRSSFWHIVVSERWRIWEIAYCGYRQFETWPIRDIANLRDGQCKKSSRLYLDFYETAAGVGPFIYNDVFMKNIYIYVLVYVALTVWELSALALGKKSRVYGPFNSCCVHKSTKL